MVRSHERVEGPDRAKRVVLLLQRGGPDPPQQPAPLVLVHEARGGANALRVAFQPAGEGFAGPFGVGRAHDDEGRAVVEVLRELPAGAFDGPPGVLARHRDERAREEHAFSREARVGHGEQDRPKGCGVAIGYRL